MGIVNVRGYLIKWPDSKEEIIFADNQKDAERKARGCENYYLNNYAWISVTKITES